MFNVRVLQINIYTCISTDKGSPARPEVNPEAREYSETILTQPVGTPARQSSILNSSPGLNGSFQRGRPIRNRSQSYLLALSHSGARTGQVKSSAKLSWCIDGCVNRRAKCSNNLPGVFHIWFSENECLLKLIGYQTPYQNLSIFKCALFVLRDRQSSFRLELSLDFLLFSTVDHS